MLLLELAPEHGVAEARLVADALDERHVRIIEIPGPPRERPRIERDDENGKPGFLGTGKKLQKMPSALLPSLSFSSSPYRGQAALITPLPVPSGAQAIRRRICARTLKVISSSCGQ